jgi:hypothetical protein
MFRMTTLALAAAATLAATALVPTTASASHPDGWRDRDSHHGWRGRDSHHGWRHNRHHNRSGFSVRFVTPHYAFAPRCYTTRRWVDTHWGWRLRTVRVCR